MLQCLSTKTAVGAAAKAKAGVTRLVTFRGKNQVATPKNRSVIKAFALLKSFRGAEEWVSSSELSRRAGLPEASGYRLVQTLEEMGAVGGGPTGCYRTGPLLLSLSHNVTLGELLPQASQPLMTELAFRLNLT